MPFGTDFWDGKKNKNNDRGSVFADNLNDIDSKNSKNRSNTVKRNEESPDNKLSSSVGRENEELLSEPAEKEKVERISGDIIYEDGYDALENKEVFKSSELAALLNVTEQTIRNWCAIYSEFIDVARKEKGHRIYTKENYLLLKEIRDLRDNRGYTIRETQVYLRNKFNSQTELEPNPPTTQERLSEIASVISMNIVESVEDIIKETVKKETRALQESINQYSSTVLEMITAVNELDNNRGADIEGIKKTMESQKDSIELIAPSIEKNTEDIYDRLLKAMGEKLSEQDEITLKLLTKSVELTRDVLKETLNEHDSAEKNDDPKMESDNVLLQIEDLRQQLISQNDTVIFLREQLNEKSEQLLQAQQEITNSQEKVHELEKKKKGVFGFFSR